MMSWHEQECHNPAVCWIAWRPHFVITLLSSHYESLNGESSFILAWLLCYLTIRGSCCLHMFVHSDITCFKFGRYSVQSSYKKGPCYPCVSQGPQPLCPPLLWLCSMAIESYCDNEDNTAIICARWHIVALEQELEVLKASNKWVKLYIFSLLLTWWSHSTCAQANQL
jgi:hypothetical protein